VFRLNGGVQRENVGLFGDVVNQFDDRSNFLRRLTQSFDSFRSFLNLVADVVHALNRLTHDRSAFRCDLHRAMRHVCALCRVFRHFVDRDRDFVDRRGSRGDLLRLMFRGFGEVHGRCLGFLGGRSYLHRGFINGGYQ
jgi:hypothetical protein